MSTAASLLEDVCTLVGRTAIINGVLGDTDDESDISTNECHKNEDIGYKFTYSISDDTDGTDSFVYDFDTFHRSQTAVCETSDSDQQTIVASNIEAPRRVTFTNAHEIEQRDVTKHKPDALVPPVNNTTSYHESNEKLKGRPRSACSLSGQRSVTQESNNITPIISHTSRFSDHYPSDGVDVHVHTSPGQQTSARAGALLASRSYYVDPEISSSVLREPHGRKLSSVSRSSRGEETLRDSSRRISSSKSVTSNQEPAGNVDPRRKSVCFDPELDKASAFIHGGGQNFSRASTSLTPPMKHGLSRLQVSYTETNLERNQSIIFLDLLKDSHKRNLVREFEIKNIERRLKTKRDNPLFATSFYEHKQLPDPFQRWTKKCARTVAQKKKERKAKIKKLTDEIHTGYEPTYLTMKIPDKTEVEDIGRKCRYLRCRRPPSAIQKNEVQETNTLQINKT